MAGPYLKVNARGWTFTISDGAATPTYTTIGGIKSFEHGFSSTDTDTSNFASLGLEEHETMARGRSLKLEGQFLEDASKNRDPGQAAVETLAEAVGAASVQSFRLTSPNGKVYTFSATAELQPQGGGNNDKTTWGVMLKRTGATTLS